MKVLITNGLRQIVSHIAELILDRGDEVDIIDNFAISRNEHLLYASNLRVEIASISDNILVQSPFDDVKPGCLIHAAAS